jgi:Polyketide cyclase / dehydrase and lipid transport
MRTWIKRLIVAAPTAVAAGAAGYLGLVTGAVPLDLGVGRRSRPLRPQQVDIAAPREVVFDVIAQPYLGRPTHAMADKVRVLERGADLVLAAHRTPVRGRLVATTVETVKFHRPDRVSFRLVRGPVPHVTEEFRLDEDEGRTRLSYRGEMAADLWSVGQWWAGAVAGRWETTVAASLAAIKNEAQRRTRHP